MNLIDTVGQRAPLARAGQGLALTQTLNDLSESQIHAIRSIPTHTDAKPRAIDARKPVSYFLDPEQFAREQAAVFRRYAVPVAPSALLPEPGTVVALDGYGVPMLLCRDKDGVVRAFLNACTHKGSKLVEDCETRRTSRLTCPYHAWTFALDGRLAGVPREELFTGLDKNQRGLAELACRESGGLVWSMLTTSAAADFSSMDPQIGADLAAFDLDKMHVYGRKSFDLAANWKLVQEPFLEGYHVQRLHARSVGPMFADVPSVTSVFGRNIRQISGKQNFTPDCLEIPGENIHKSVTHAYLVFPSTVIVTSPYYISVMVLMPRGVNRTVVDYYMLTRDTPESDKAADLYQRSFDMIIGVFGGEDFRASEISHEGLASGALQDVVYCGLEENIPRYYDILDAAM